MAEQTSTIENSKDLTDYSVTKGNIRFLNNEALLRPFDFPRKYLIAGFVLILIAAAIGGFALYKVFYKVYYEPSLEQERFEQAIARPVDYNFPPLALIMPWDDFNVKQYLVNFGLTTIETSNPEDFPAGGFTAFRVPETITSDKAKSLLNTGINKLSAADAATMLNGGWFMYVYRDEYVDMRIKYADFTSADIQSAINRAVASQGWDQAILGESGVDSSGNTFQAGNVERDGVVYSWRVSACELSAVYDFHEFPQNAFWVGIRITE